MEEEREDEGDEAGKALLSPASEGGESVQSASVTSPTDAGTGDDVADRAAAMLEGLTGGGLAKDGSLVIRRRRENADSERERRRRRRQQASTTSSGRGEDAGGLMSPTIAEDGEDGFRRGSVVSGDGSEGPRTPITIVSPPSPGKSEDEDRGEGRRLPTPPPER
jgi:cytokinesis protein